MSKITVTRLYKEDINTFLPLVQELMEHHKRIVVPVARVL